MSFKVFQLERVLVCVTQDEIRLCCNNKSTLCLVYTFAAARCDSTTTTSYICNTSVMICLNSKLSVSCHVLQDGVFSETDFPCDPFFCPLVLQVNWSKVNCICNCHCNTRRSFRPFQCMYRTRRDNIWILQHILMFPLEIRLLIRWHQILLFLLKHAGHWNEGKLKHGQVTVRACDKEALR